MEADDDGFYVVKFQAAGQGHKALVAEVIIGELARAAGLPVPEVVLVELDAVLGRTEPDPEINELISASAGLNLGVDFLPGALDYTPSRDAPLAAERASEIVWFDALSTNVDRTPRNPNLLVWHRQVWLIDHGAALYQHHGDRDLVPRAREAFPLIADHVLLPLASRLSEVDERMSRTLDQSVVRDAVALVPDAWLGADPAVDRAAYMKYFGERLVAPRTFVVEAETARDA
jgi:hypothetical protein